MTSATVLPQREPRRPDDSFALRLVMIRYELGMDEMGRMLPVDQIAERCGISAATWSTWERGTSPRNLLDVVVKIAKATGYDRDWIAWGFSLSTQRKLTLLQGGRRASDVKPPAASPILRSVDPDH